MKNGISVDLLLIPFFSYKYAIGYKELCLFIIKIRFDILDCKKILRTLCN